MSKNTTSDGERPVEPGDAEGTLTLVTVESEDQPTECTLLPFDSDVEDIATRWITTTEESVLSLEEMR